MDLTERGDSAMRHPWEVQRFEAYRRVLAAHDALGARRVLDVGAGDGWFSDRLVEHLPHDAEIVCWDVNYDDNELEPTHPRLVRTRERPRPGHDLVLLLDVLEHVEHPSSFIETVVGPLTVPGTPVLVAVPAHQWLFGTHDESLGHHRRYSRRRLLEQLSPWLDVVEDGPLFTSLLLPRAVSVGLERLAPRRRTHVDHGVGNWSGGPMLTSIANRVLAVDARVGRAARRVHLRLPGLSHWVYGVVR